MSDIPGRQGLYGLSGDAEIQGATTFRFASAPLWMAALMAAFGLPYSVSALLSGQTPLHLGLSLLALALACLALWLSRRVWKDPALRTPSPFAVLLFPVMALLCLLVLLSWKRLSTRKL
ncbi:hypothetical protein MF271_08280 [Deinococcus sp. KNUC1210]|uniref:hypothetical protein n=1 Tax=Deinococcus sp. KNUC1210 TaxID=2917691 RepID=UPI001EF006DD|nr:hypothetical protein [Deinococcus sp. KNUC1210]ULH16556.1 hypothetical protein MF271_08280 [Deinococcus sp. KNUC1210]